MSLTVKNIGKQYKNGFWGIRDIDLEIQSGVLGFLGPNGAGKSTLMRIMATVTRPTTGTLLWEGEDVWQNLPKYRSILGYLPQDFGVYPQLNPVEFLSYMAAMKGIVSRDAQRQINELLHLVNLQDALKTPIGKMSGGMKQRVGIAQALLGNPRLLIVDEPTVGLDPEERMRFRNLLSELAAERTVIFSTHIVSDIEATAARIAVAFQGRLIIHTTPERMLEEIRGKVWDMVIPANDLSSLREDWLLGGTTRTPEGVRVRLISDKSPGNNARMLEPTLEDAYLYFTSGKQDGEGR